jgi:hypothetical protein
LALNQLSDWFFSHETEGIILEDDCIPHLDFFSFCVNNVRSLSHMIKRIISINGSNLGYQLNNGESYTYSRFMNMWGWATWADRAREIDYSLSDVEKSTATNLVLVSTHATTFV